MTTISAGAPVVTLINVFTVAPERQQELVDLLVSATDTVMMAQPGFVSANIHVALDGTRVANYAQWASQQAMADMLANPACQEHMQQAAAVADGVEPHLYRVASVHMLHGI